MPINDEAAARSGERIGFSFGENWQRYLDGVDEKKLAQAEESLSASFGGEDLAGQTFLDIGCGSGVFSLAARRMGAQVTSVDVDPASVACAEQLRGDDREWSVVQQSILQPQGLPTATRVYSWGVLHHTGAMWEAVDNALALVEPGGLACIALYSRPAKATWHMRLKRVYNRLPRVGQLALKYVYGGRLLVLGAVVDRRNPLAYIRNYGRESRGMGFWRDVEDWLGGLPCEFANPDEFLARIPAGFDLVRVLPAPGGGCSEYLLRRTSMPKKGA